MIGAQCLNWDGVPSEVGGPRFNFPFRPPAHTVIGMSEAVVVAPVKSERVRDWCLALLLLLGIGTYQWINRWHDFAFFSDAGAYLAGARSLAAGEGYRFVSHEGQPKISLYPPLQSVLLAPAFKWGPPFPENVPILHGIMIALGGLTLGLVYAFLRAEGMPRAPVAWFIVLWGISTQWMMWLGFIVSDVAFAGVPAGLALIWRADQNGPEWRRWLWLGLGLGIAYWLRTATQAWSLALAVIVIGRCLLGGNWLRAACFVVPVAASALLWRKVRAGGVDYGDFLIAYFYYEGGWSRYFRTLAGHVWVLVRGYEFWPFMASPVRRQQLLWQEAHKWWLVVPTLLVLAVGHVWWLGRTAMGFLRGICERDLAVLLGLAIYSVQIFLVPFNGYDYQRYLQPFGPFLFLWFWRSRGALPGMEKSSARAISIPLAALWLLNVFGLKMEDDFVRRRIPLEEVREMANWFRENTPAEERVAMDWNLPVEHWRVWTGRRILVNEAVRSGVVNPVRRWQQPPIQPNYFLWSPVANSADPQPPAGELVRKSPSGALQLYRFPPPPSTGAGAVLPKVQ